MCAQAVVEFAKHIGIQSARGPDSVHGDAKITSLPSTNAPHVA